MKHSQQQSTHDKELRRTETRNYIPAFALLAIALLLGSQPAKAGHIDINTMAWAGMSFLGVLALVLAAVSGYRKADELEKQVRLRAAAAGFMYMTIGLFAAELLHALNVLSMVALAQIVLISGVVFWAGVQAILGRKNQL